MVANPSPNEASIARVRAVVYARGADAREEDHAVAQCERWAARHDWEVGAVVRETSDIEPPLERWGVRVALGLLNSGRASVLLALSRITISDENAAFHAVCAAAESAGGFVHVLDSAESGAADARP
ncbi:hypothetical protein SAMN04489712_103378 [Thermomonospora echinospora]|uniref:Resolvase, N terminal domain n=1 Tax=Thermomonospora echinospora TaxID=1992 RepID=A0A1H5XRF0_9ACTN|nr:hypothetical protein [Thermomonospora echinospora]SEG14389.1 hypothetical protein SAMN04489712_103378 [Thermomonospora echinospora]